MHTCPFTPDVKTIYQNLIFLFLTTNYSSIVSKLEPVDWDERRARTMTSREPNLTIFFYFDMLNECVKIEVKQ